MSEAQEPIYMIEIEGENFMRLKAFHVQFTPDAGLTVISGANEQGKTSLLRAVSAMFGGAGAIVEDPIHDAAAEEERSWIKGTLNNGYSVERRFTPAARKGYLTVVSPDGGKYGQELLDGWIGEFTFSPGAWLGLTPREKKKVLMELSPDREFEAKLEALNAERDRLHKERTPHITTKRDAGKVAKPEGDRPEPVDVAADMARLDTLQEERHQIEAAWDRMVETEQEVDAIEARIARLKEELNAAGLKLVEAAVRKDEAQQAYESARSHDEIAAEVEPLRARLAAANETTKALREWERYDEAQARLAESTQAEQDLTAAIKAIEAQKGELLASGGPNIEHLSFDDDGTPLYKGRSLEEASGAERLLLATHIAFLANNQLKFCLLDEANDLDLDHLKALDLAAKQYGFQILACRLGIEGDGDVVVRDGVARNRED